MQKNYPINNPLVSEAIYKSIAKMDRDKDGTACEKWWLRMTIGKSITKLALFDKDTEILCFGYLSGLRKKPNLKNERKKDG